MKCPDFIGFDVETIPDQTIQDELKPQFDESTVKLGNLKDRFKIQEKMDEARAEFSLTIDKRMATNPDTCQIVALTILNGPYRARFAPYCLSEYALGSVEEFKILTETWKLIASRIASGAFLVSFNGGSFDLPVMIRRSMLLDVYVPRDVLLAVLSRTGGPHIDLMNVLGVRSPFSGKIEARSLDYYLKRFELTPKTPGWDGSKVYPAFKEKRYEEILEYNKQDVEGLCELFERVSPWLPINTRRQTDAITPAKEAA